MLIILFSTYFLYIILIPLFLIMLPIGFGSPGVQMATNKGLHSPLALPTPSTLKGFLWRLWGWAQAHLEGWRTPRAAQGLEREDARAVVAERGTQSLLRPS